METVALLLIFIIAGIMGFFVMKKLDKALVNVRRQPEYITESREDVIKIVCENPIMLSSVAAALDQMPKEYKKKTSFCYYTASKKDIQKMVDKEKIDIVLLLDETGIINRENYKRKVSSFHTSAMTEPSTGLNVEPVGDSSVTMYVWWNEKTMIMKHQTLLSYI